jgi:hypothetical protein
MWNSLELQKTLSKNARQKWDTIAIYYHFFIHQELV